MDGNIANGDMMVIEDSHGFSHQQSPHQVPKLCVYKELAFHQIYGNIREITFANKETQPRNPKETPLSAFSSVFVLKNSVVIW